MRNAFLAGLILLSACSKKTVFVKFEDPAKHFTAEVPVNWRPSGQADLSRRPAALMTWIAEISAEKEGRQVGAMIHINRFDRTDVPPYFRKSTIDPTDAMFGKGQAPSDAPMNIEEFKFAGYDARRYRRDFETMLGGGMHSVAGPFPMRLEDVVIQTPAAYYVLEYRATQRLFDKHYAAFQRTVETFKIRPRP